MRAFLPIESTDSDSPDCNFSQFQPWQTTGFADGADNLGDYCDDSCGCDDLPWDNDLY